jgi:hypothetical protein
MTEPNPPPRAQVNAEDGQLRVLATLHFVAAGLSLAGIGLLLWHYARMHAAFLDVTAGKRQHGGSASLEEFFLVFRQFYLVAGAVLAACAVGNLLSGFFIRGRRHHLLSLAVACLNCLVVPIGTVFGAFTLVVLLRDAVRDQYAARAPGHAAPDRSGRRPAQGGSAR